MNEIIKLLIEEPHRIEKMIILFIKLVITYSIFSVVSPSVVPFVEMVQVDHWITMNVSQIVISVLFFVITWFLLWSLLCETIIRLTIKKISSLYNPKEEIQALLKVIEWLISKPKEKKHIHYSILWMEGFLESQQDEGEVDMSDFRFDVYFEIYVVSSIWILMSGDVELSIAGSIIWWLVGINLLASYLVFQRAVSYINDSFTQILHEIRRHAFHEKIKMALVEIKGYAHLIEPKFYPNRIELNSKHEYGGFAQSVTIRFEYVKADDLRIEFIPEYFKKKGERISEKGDSKRYLYITNVPLSISTSALERANSSIIVASDLDEMKSGLEQYFQLTAKEFPPDFSKMEKRIEETPSQTDSLTSET